MTTRIKVDGRLVDKFGLLKEKKIRFLSAKINDSRTSIILDDEMKGDDRSLKYGDMLCQLPERECRWIIFSYEFQTKPGGEDVRDIVFLLCWCPPSSPIRMKMIFAGGKQVLKIKCPGIMMEMGTTDVSEAGEEEIIAKLTATMV